MLSTEPSKNIPSRVFADGQAPQQQLPYGKKFQCQQEMMQLLKELFVLQCTMTNMELGTKLPSSNVVPGLKIGIALLFSRVASACLETQSLILFIS
jgi:hypothetical protein